MSFARLSAVPLVLALASLATAATAPAPPDATTPKGAMKSFYRALEIGDALAVRSLLSASNDREKQFADAFADFLVAARNLGLSVKGKFAASGDALSRGLPAREEMAAVGSAEIHTDGDAATVKLSGQAKPLKLTKSGGTWRLDVASYAGVAPDAMPAQTATFKEMAGAFNTVAHDIDGDKFASAQDAQRALQQKLGAILFNTLQKNPPPATAPAAVAPGAGTSSGK